MAIGLSLIDYHKIANLSSLIYIGCLIILAAVLLIGKLVSGATRWIVVPGIGQIQPSEFAKIGLIIFFSWYFNKYQERPESAGYAGNISGSVFSSCASHIGRAQFVYQYYYCAHIPVDAFCGRVKL